MATWVTDLRHYLDDDGELPDLPWPALSLALFQGAIVAWVTSRPKGGGDITNVPCRRRPGKATCIAEVEARLQPVDQSIQWRCPACGDNGVIRGWEQTRWDRRRHGVLLK
jgi:predicted RNA-binding Zn-ribbon protein involved in translation (DUF1610 family)